MRTAKTSPWVIIGGIAAVVIVVGLVGQASGMMDISSMAAMNAASASQPARLQDVEYKELTANGRSLLMAQRQGNSAAGPVANPRGTAGVADLTGMFEIGFSSAINNGVVDNLVVSFTETAPGSRKVVLGGANANFAITDVFEVTVADKNLRLRFKAQDVAAWAAGRDTATSSSGSQQYTYTVTFDVQPGMKDASGRDIDATVNDATFQFVTVQGAKCSQQPSSGCPSA
jgi:hypothetical protein